jgi:hypothetical protein
MIRAMVFRSAAIAFCLMLAIVARPAAVHAADAAGLLKSEIAQYIRTAWRNAPTNYAALKGAAIPGVAGHFRAKLPVGTFMKHCEVAGSGAAIFCATPLFPGGRDAEPVVEQGIEAALPPGFVAAPVGPNEDARWMNAAARRAILLVSETGKDENAVRYYIWIVPIGK